MIPEDAATPDHTLIQFTDTHLVPEDARLAGGHDPLPGLAAALGVVEDSGLRPAALLFTGDLVEGGDAASYRRFRALVEPAAARIGVPVIHVLGNHDDRATARVHLLDEPASTDPHDRVVWLGALRVVVLDTTVPGASHGELTPAQLAWLGAELAVPAPDGTVLALHHPPLPTSSPLSAAIELADRAALGTVLAGSDVRIVLAGHTHVVSAGAIAGIPVWTGGSTSTTWDALAADGRGRTVRTPAVSRIDVFADDLLVTAVAVGAETVAAVDRAELEEMIARLTRR
ncbi:metallophosphoesterase [Pseudonocardia sp.]|uniref:metallophosphoesterase n=1 Tax=Pseudonocardia sp. TaxID=60912 RepID=UPI00261193A3|nr:metallophosphoesterase [Pseudonocardia sp.]